MDAVIRQCRSWHEQGFTTMLFSMNRGEDERMQELLEGRLEAVQFLIGPLRKGFVLPKDKLAVLCSAEILGRSYRAGRGWKPMCRLCLRIPMRGTNPIAGRNASPICFEFRAMFQRSFG